MSGLEGGTDEGQGLAEIEASDVHRLKLIGLL